MHYCSSLVQAHSSDKEDAIGLCLHGKSLLCHSQSQAVLSSVVAMPLSHAASPLCGAHLACHVVQ